MIKRKPIKIPLNPKPWFNNTVKALLWDRDSALRSGDKEAYSKARANLNRGTKSAINRYKEQTEANLRENNPRSIWQGIQNIMDYK